MKNMIAAALVLVSASSAFAAKDKTVKVTPATSHIEVTLHSAQEHNCPGMIDVRVKTTSAGPAQKVVLEQNGDANLAVERLVAQMSSECQSEAEEIKLKEQMGPVCLSFGKSWAVVTVQVVEGAKSVRITAPLGLEITNVQQLGKVNSSTSGDGEVDCSVRPPAVFCCQAEIPSCISCRQKSRARQAAWDKACNN